MANFPEPQKSDTGDADYKLEMVELFKKGEISKARKLVVQVLQTDEIEDIYKWLYDNIDLFGDEEKQESAILIIKQGLVDHTLVADPEINLAATLIRFKCNDISGVNDKCIKCKHTDCVEVCLVDCFYEGENMLVINPDECIDCGVCVLNACPVDAIISESEDPEQKW